MQAKTSAVILTVLMLIVPSASSALELGIEDDGSQTTVEQRDTWAVDVGAHWERIVAYIGQPNVANRIRASHTAGRKVILTVGGGGTRSRRPNFTKALRYIATLPRADRYTIENEPVLDGAHPCSYRRNWMRARRVLGRRLLWGDDSGGAVSFTIAAAKCGRLPRPLAMAVHPYQSSDPFAPTHLPPINTNQVALGNLPLARKTLAKHGIRVQWWLTEFGYVNVGTTEGSVRLTGVTDDLAAWMWPRAILQARRVHARVLIVYMAQGPTWDTRPREEAWAAIRSTSI